MCKAGQDAGGSGRPRLNRAPHYLIGNDKDECAKGYDDWVWIAALWNNFTRPSEVDVVANTAPVRDLATHALRPDGERESYGKRPCTRAALCYSTDGEKV